jgi:hypothetical protein
MIMPSLGFLWLQPLFLSQFATTAGAFLGPGVVLRRPSPASSTQLFGEYEEYMAARRRAQEQQQQQQSSPQGQPPFPDLSDIKNLSKPPPQQQQQTNPFENAGSDASTSVKKNYSPGGGPSLWKTTTIAGSSSTPAPPTTPPITTTPTILKVGTAPPIPMRLLHQSNSYKGQKEQVEQQSWSASSSSWQPQQSVVAPPPPLSTTAWQPQQQQQPSSWAENNNSNVQSNAAPSLSWSNSDINLGDNKYGNEPSLDPPRFTAGAAPVLNDNKSLLGTTSPTAANDGSGWRKTTTKSGGAAPDPSLDRPVTAGAAPVLENESLLEARYDTTTTNNKKEDEESSLPWWKISSDNAESSSLDPPTAAGQAPVLATEKLRTGNLLGGDGFDKGTASRCIVIVVRLVESRRFGQQKCRRNAVLRINSAAAAQESGIEKSNISR